MARAPFRIRTSLLRVSIVALATASLWGWETLAQRRTRPASGQVVVHAPAADGALDPTFNLNGVNTQFFGSDTSARVDTAVGIGVQKLGLNAGKIVVAGDTSGGGVADLAVTRFNIDGSPDDGSVNDLVPADVFGTAGKTTTDFGPNHVDQNSIYSGSNFVAIDPTDDRIVVVGTSNTGTHTGGCLDDVFAVARYTPDGLPDTAGFNAAGTVNGSRLLDFTGGGSCASIAEGVTVQPDHKIVIVGIGFNTIAQLFLMVRLNEDGSLDTSFNGNGSFLTLFSLGEPYAVRQIGGNGPDAGKYIVVGDRSVSGQGLNFVVIRMNSNGTQDMTFGPANTGSVETSFTAGNINETARSVVIQPDGKILVGGEGGSGSAFAMARYDSDGGLDPTFGTGGKVLVDTVQGSTGDVGTTVNLMSSGQIVMTGKGASGQGIVLARFTCSGALDTTFDGDGIATSNAGAANGPLNRTGILQLDDRILVAGNYSGAVTPVNDFFAARFQNTPGAPCITTAARVTVTGRVTTADGTSLRNATVTLVDSSGARRSAVTNTFGYYAFDEVQSGQSVVVSVASRRYIFAPNSRVVNVTDAVSRLDFVSSP